MARGCVGFPQTTSVPIVSITPALPTIKLVPTKSLMSLGRSDRRKNTDAGKSAALTTWPSPGLKKRTPRSSKSIFPTKNSRQKRERGLLRYCFFISHKEASECQRPIVSDAHQRHFIEFCYLSQTKAPKVRLLILLTGICSDSEIHSIVHPCFRRVWNACFRMTNSSRLVSCGSWIS